MARHLSRILARVAAVVVMAFAFAAAYATPAHAAAAADLEVKLVGTTLADGADEKFATSSIINHGPGDASGIELTFDATALNATKVDLELPGSCTGSPVAVCTFPGLVIAAGEDFDIGPLIKRNPGQSGDAGQLTVSVAHDGTDSESSNNSATAAVSLPDISGPDLTAVALDVYQDTDDAPGEPGPNTPIQPGGTSNLWVVVLNQGDTTANGVKMTITLPEHVSFNEAEPDCTHAVGDSTTVCEYETVVLTPAPDDDALGFFFFPVKVAADVEGPVALTDGVVTVAAINEQPPPPAARALPRNFTRIQPDGLNDVDPTDNTDEFTVFVAGPLPVTGARAGLIGATGAVLVALGVGLYLIARRRRPAEVKP